MTYIYHRRPDRCKPTDGLLNWYYTKIRSLLPVNKNLPVIGRRAQYTIIRRARKDEGCSYVSNEPKYEPIPPIHNPLNKGITIPIGGRHDG